MTTSENRIIVVRAWRDSDRLVIRIISTAGPATAPVEWVCDDIDSAGERLAAVLREML